MPAALSAVARQVQHPEVKPDLMWPLVPLSSTVLLTLTCHSPSAKFNSTMVQHFSALRRVVLRAANHQCPSDQLL